jgi:hypothetical protein
VKLHTKKLKTPKMIRRKLKTQELPKIKTKNPSKFTRQKFTRAKHHPPFTTKKKLKKKIEDQPQTLKRNHSARKL